jgi:RsiW-degrading membrane proteinase PrsW (M82 family)
MILPGTQIRIGLLGCFLALVSVVAVIVVAIIVVAAVPDRFGLALSVTAASIPALFYAWLVLRLDRFEVEPARVIVACFAWGAVGAVLFTLIAGALFERTLRAYLDEEAVWFTQIALGAPVIEESFKGIAVLILLLVARHEVDNVLDGLVYGALVGVGFAMTENIIYFGQAYIENGFREFGNLVIARAVLSGLGHPAYTAVTGAAIGWSRSQYGRGFARLVVPIFGWAIAVGLHMAWNAGLFVTAFILGPDTGLLQMVAIQAAIVIAPAVLVLYAIARISTRHELQILRTELRGEVERGIITEAEYRAIVDVPARRQALAVAWERGGRPLQRAQRAFFHAAADLAFRHHHRGRGEAERADAAALDRRDRERLADLRTELSAFDDGRDSAF